MREKKKSPGSVRLPRRFSFGNGHTETYKDFKDRKRGLMEDDRRRSLRERPLERGVPHTPPAMGTLSDDQLKDASLMVHPSKGERYMLNEDVEKKEKQGWVLKNPRPKVTSKPKAAAK